MSTDLHYLTIAEGAARIRSRDLSPVDWTRHLIARIEALNPRLDAFVVVTAEHALDQAAEAEAEIAAGKYRGPLHGVPFALKDIYDTAGIATTGQSKLCAGRVPERDAATVRRLKDAGAVLLGKLTTHEFAYGGPSFDLPGPPGPQPLGYGSFHRRLVERFGRRRRRRVGAGGHGVLYRRLDPHPGRLLRPGRA